MKCKGCEKEAATKKGWCSVGCYRQNQHLVQNNGRKTKTKRVTVICKECGKRELKTVPQSKKYTYCSIACSTKNNIKPSKVINCLNCKAPVEQKPWQAKNTKVKKFCNQACYAEYHSSGNHKYGRITTWTEKNCLTCNIHFEVPPSRSDTAKYCSRKCHNIGNIQNMKKAGTSIEIAIENILKELNIQYTTQKPLLRLTVVDFFIEPNIVIYADGDYWHNLPESIKRDKRNNAALKEAGYDVLRFWGSQIQDNPNQVMEQINETIDRKSSL